jgi:hypothetical protein
MITKYPIIIAPITVKLKFVNDISLLPQNNGKIQIISNCANGDFNISFYLSTSQTQYLAFLLLLPYLLTLNYYTLFLNLEDVKNLVLLFYIYKVYLYY